MRHAISKEMSFASAESIDPYQPVQLAQVDMGQNFAISLFFLQAKRSVLSNDLVGH